MAFYTSIKPYSLCLIDEKYGLVQQIFRPQTIMEKLYQNSIQRLKKLVALEDHIHIRVH